MATAPISKTTPSSPFQVLPNRRSGNLLNKMTVNLLPFYNEINDKYYARKNGKKTAIRNAVEIGLYQIKLAAEQSRKATEARIYTYEKARNQAVDNVFQLVKDVVKRTAQKTIEQARLAQVAAVAAQKPAEEAKEADVQAQEDEELGIVEVKWLIDRVGCIYKKYLGSGTFGMAHLIKDPQGNTLVLKTVPYASFLEKKDFWVHREIEILKTLTENKIASVPHYRGDLLNEKGQLRGFFMTAFATQNLYDACLDLENPKIRHLKLDEILTSFVPKLLKFLSDLEKLKLVHADLKPNNMSYDENGNLGVYDWGLARYLEECREGDPCRPILYYSPLEVVLGRPLDCSTDMWSAACIIFEVYKRTALCPAHNDSEMLSFLIGRFGKDAIRQLFIRCGSDPKHVDSMKTGTRSWRESLQKSINAKTDCPKKFQILIDVLDLMFRFENKPSADQVLDFLRSSLNESRSEASPMSYIPAGDSGDEADASEGPGT